MNDLWPHVSSCSTNLSIQQHMHGGLFAFGCQSSWQSAAESQRPPRGSALACPHCLAGDRSDTEANTCSSEEGDLAKRRPLYNPPTHAGNTHSSTHMSNVYHPWQVTQNRTLRCMYPAITPLSFVFFTHSKTHVPAPHNERLLCQYTRGSWSDPAISQACRCFRLQTHLWSGWLPQ